MKLKLSRNILHFPNRICARFVNYYSELFGFSQQYIYNIYRPCILLTFYCLQITRFTFIWTIFCFKSPKKSAGVSSPAGDTGLLEHDTSLSGLIFNSFLASFTTSSLLALLELLLRLLLPRPLSISELSFLTVPLLLTVLASVEAPSLFAPFIELSLKLKLLSN